MKNIKTSILIGAPIVASILFHHKTDLVYNGIRCCPLKIAKCSLK